MIRNKRNIVRATNELTPLTKHILAKMGPEGKTIRNRLKKFLNNLTSDQLKIVGKSDSLGSKG